MFVKIQNYIFDKIQRNTDWLYSAIFSVFYISLFSLSTTPLYDYAALDSEMFQNIGMAILRGKVPYVDLFDHKGCILFFINAICIGLNKTWGLWLFQCVHLCLNFYLWIKIIKFFTPKFSALYLSITMFFILEAYFSEGNLSEEWSLLLIGLPVYWSVKAISRHQLLPMKHLFYVGLCIGIVTFIRVNNILLIIGYLVWFLWISIRKKKYIYIGKGIALIGLGILLPTSACTLYFYMKGGAAGVEELWFGTIGFNLEYMQKYNSSSPSTLQFIIMSYAPVMMMAFLSLLCIKKDKNQIIPLLFSYSIGLFFVGETLFRHYFLVFVPLYVVTWAAICKAKYSSALQIVVLLTFAGASWKPIKRYVSHFTSGRETRVRMRCVQFENMISKIPVEERTCIWNYNGQEVMDAIVDADIVQCNRIIIPFHLDISEKLANAERNKILKVQPQWILVNRKYVIGDLIDREFIEKNYSPVDSTCVDGMENVVLLHRCY